MRYKRLVSGDEQSETHAGSLELGVLRPESTTGYIDFELRLDLADAAYDYSKLYYSLDPKQPYREEEAICFRIKEAGGFERVRLLLPEGARKTGYLRLRVDGLPYSAGTFRIRELRLVPADVSDDRARRAHLHANKQWVRKQVEISEEERRVVLSHYPESVSLELTPRCNLTCEHCSSHGTPELHRHNNSLPIFDEAKLERFAHEVFPHLTQLTIVGRGEPTLVPLGVWRRLIALLKHYDVFLCCVTNGYFIEERIDEETLRVMDTLTFSVDGMTRETFARNRGGADLERVLHGVRHYCDLRERVPLARRPRLGFSWTLKRNNIAELPAFIEFIKQFDPDYLYVRHLLTFHEKDHHESLVSAPDLANKYLREAYQRLENTRIKHDCPPLQHIDTAAAAEESAPERLSVITASPEPAQYRAADRVHLAIFPDESTNATIGDEIACPHRLQVGGAPAMTSPTPGQDLKCLYFHRTGVIMADGEVVTCANMYAENAGRLGGARSFLEVWNGARMQAVRASFGGANEWKQCSSCWFREIRYQTQRATWKNLQQYEFQSETSYSEQAWDFRGFEKAHDRR